MKKATTSSTAASTIASGESTSSEDFNSEVLTLEQWDNWFDFDVTDEIVSESSQNSDTQSESDKSDDDVM